MAELVILRSLWSSFAIRGSSCKSCLQTRTCNLIAVRHFFVASSLLGKRPHSVEEEEIDIPGLERITFADRMYRVPGLAEPKFPEWNRGWRNPFQDPGPKYEEMPLFKEKTCYVFHQKTKLLEGVKQALWLTKSKLIQGLPKQIVCLAEDPDLRIENQDDRVQQAIRHARFWDTTEIRPPKEKYCGVLLSNLLHLCRMLSVQYPSLSKRILAENYRVAASWTRESSLFQVRGINGLLLNSTSPLPPLATQEEVQATESHILETFYPISPTIDLQEVHVYDEKNDTGFKQGYPYPHAHTLYILNPLSTRAKFQQYQLQAKMIMFAFGNLLARARLLYGEQPRVLETPLVMQSIATNGRVFQFVVFQLNTTDLSSSDGIKNLVWLDQDQELYEYAKCFPEIKRKVVVVPVGVSGYQPETFKKFVAMYLHGAVQPSIKTRVSAS